MEYEQTAIQSMLTQADEEQKTPSPFFNGVQELLVSNISVASKFTIIYCKPIFPKFNDHINLQSKNNFQFNTDLKLASYNQYLSQNLQF